MNVSTPYSEAAPADKYVRRSVRVALKVPMTILGRDRSGQEYALSVQTIDISKHGFSIELPSECVASGDEVFISVATKFNARAKIRWLGEPDEKSKAVRCGVELTEPYSNWVLR